MKPVAIDLFCGLGGWSHGLIAEGYDVIGFDIERHSYGDDKYPGQMVIQDVLTIHGSQFKDASLIVASPPCQEFSYMAMPWSLAKAKRAAILSDTSGAARARLTALFDACFRIQREAIEAAGHFIPLVVENVRGTNEWVGRSRWNFGSFHLWGDVPALMPMTQGGRKSATGSCARLPGANGGKLSGWPHIVDGIKQPGISGIRENGKGDKWFQDGAAKHGSKSNARKQAAATIAKIPFPLACHIAKYWKPVESANP